ncbi:MAG: IPT/TIG domain-containing protein [Nitrososphaeraceae archaeon]
MSRRDNRSPRPLIRRYSRDVIGHASTKSSIPLFPGISNGLWVAVRSSNPDYDRGSVIELSAASILDQAKAKLQSLGVENFNDVGDITFTQHLVINRPGLIAPGTFGEAFSEPSMRSIVRSHSDPLKEALGLVSADILTWPQTESVIIADELDLTNKTITILRDQVSHLWIIARRLKASVGAQITYTPLVNANVGAKGQNGVPDPGEPNFNPDVRQSSSDFRANNGGDGNRGVDGRTGPTGKDAPHLTICALEVDAMPDIVLPGQQGGRGGAGGHGANGGNGQRGRDSKVTYVFGNPVDCARGPGWGGNGGRGGDGGKGGKGGVGGRGANITIATQQDQLTPLLTSSPFILNNGIGPGGEAGPQGDPGNGGLGGAAGYRTAWPCSEEPQRHGNNGTSGNHTGDLGGGGGGITGFIQYSIITQEEWESKLEAPWITSIDPSIGFAGDQVIIHGLHFVNGSKVVMGNHILQAIFNYPEQMTFLIPVDFDGGETSIYILGPDQDASNTVPFSVRPFVKEIRKDNMPVSSVYGGDEITVMGKSFSSGASVYANGHALQTTHGSNSQIDVRIPIVYGEDSGGDMQLMVHNPDGLESNELSVTRLPSLDSGFRAAKNGYQFKNFTNGNPDWDCFLDTFGSEEVGLQLYQHPILTSLFFGFYYWFLSNNGHCSAMASATLQYFHQGGLDLYSQTPLSTSDPPPISSALMHMIDVNQGRVLSKELITHYADQSQEGVNRVEKSIREIESDFRDGLGESTARLLCFIHSGSVWDIFADEETRKAFLNSHAVTPTRIIYPDLNRSLNGAKLYIYDNNRPGEDNIFLDLSMQADKVQFKYITADGTELSTQTGFTLGTATLQKQLINDVALPFSGGGIMAFVVELMMSSAHIRIEDDSGKFIGIKDGKAYSDANLGYVCPWFEDCLLLRVDANVTRRRIAGHSDGKYTYASLHPNGRSLTIKDAFCSMTTHDVILIDPSFSNIEISCRENKTIDLHIAQALDDGVVRYLNINHQIEQNETTKIRLEQRLNGVNIYTPHRDLNMSLIIKQFHGNGMVEERSVDTTVPMGRRLNLPHNMWDNIDSFDVDLH